MIALDYDWEESFDYMVDENCYISAFFHVAHRKLKDLAEALEKTKTESSFGPDTSWAEELLSRNKEEIEDNMFYSKMSYTAQAETEEQYVPEAAISAEVKYLWEKTGHDLTYFDQESYDRLFSDSLVRHIREEIRKSRSDLI